MARQRRAGMVQGFWRAALVMVFPVMSLANGSEQCQWGSLQSKITWLANQCEAPCPGYEKVQCTFMDMPQITIDERTYCCVCAQNDDGQGSGDLKLCGNTGSPVPKTTQKVVSASISGVGEVGVVRRTRLRVQNGQSAFVEVEKNNEWARFQYLELSVTWEVDPVAVMRRDFSPYSVSAAVNSSTARDSASLPERLPEHRTEAFAMRPYTIDDRTPHEGRVSLPASPPAMHFSSSNMLFSGQAAIDLSGPLLRSSRWESDARSSPRWTVRAREQPNALVEPEFADYIGHGNSSIDVIPALWGWQCSSCPPCFPCHAHGAARPAQVVGPVRENYFIRLGPPVISSWVEVSAVARVAKELDTVPQTFWVGPGLRAYLVTRASFAGLSFMRYRFTSSRKDAVFRLFTAHHTLATGFNWHKRRSGQAPGGADPEGTYSDAFFSSILLAGPKSGSEEDRSGQEIHPTWTVESDSPAELEAVVETVAARRIAVDDAVTFKFGDARVELMVISPLRPSRGRLYFQIMPSYDADAREAYPSWETLMGNLRLVSTATLEGERTYSQISDWGYTSDKIPGIQVMVGDWDTSTDVYFEIYLRPGKPSVRFTAVCYQVDSTFSTWRWWFGSVLFSMLVFCIARCFLCRRRIAPAESFDRGRSVQLVPLALAMGAGGLPPRAAPEAVMATEPPPTRLRKVADMMYRREGAPGECATSHEPDAGGGEEDVTCVVCLDRPRESVLLECGHGGLCVPCAISLWRQGPARRHCPMCRKAFVGVVRIVQEQDGVAEVRCLSSQSPAANGSLQVTPGSGINVWGRWQVDVVEYAYASSGGSPAEQSQVVVIRSNES